MLSSVKLRIFLVARGSTLEMHWSMHVASGQSTFWGSQEAAQALRKCRM